MLLSFSSACCPTVHDHVGSHTECACLPAWLPVWNCRKDEFWIACDLCDMWWCGRCSKVRLLRCLLL
jgi:hypothetical protein